MVIVVIVMCVLLLENMWERNDMNTIVFPVQVVGHIAAGAYVRADEARKEIERLKQELKEAKKLLQKQGDILIRAGVLLDKDAMISDLERLLSEVRTENRMLHEAIQLCNNSTE